MKTHANWEKISVHEGTCPQESTTNDSTLHRERKGNASTAMTTHSGGICRNFMLVWYVHQGWQACYNCNVCVCLHNQNPKERSLLQFGWHVTLADTYGRGLAQFAGLVVNPQRRRGLQNKSAAAEVRLLQLLARTAALRHDHFHHKQLSSRTCTSSLWAPAQAAGTTLSALPAASCLFLPDGHSSWVQFAQQLQCQRRRRDQIELGKVTRASCAFTHSPRMPAGPCQVLQWRAMIKCVSDTRSHA
jgi:hypothetical protein